MSEGAQAVVLAGGRATRLGDLAQTVPKFLLPVAGRPFAAWVLDKLGSCGYSDVVLCVGHLGDAIRDYVDDGRRFGLTVRYVDDGPRLLGTGGALRRAEALLADRFLVTYGDSYLPFDYLAPLRDLAAHDDALGTLAVYRNLGRFDRSNVRVEGDWIAEYRQSSHPKAEEPALQDIDYGAMALRREAVLRVAAGRPYGLDALQAELAQERKLRALRALQRFYEIGSSRGLTTLDAELAAHPHDYPNSDASSESGS